ncbi:MAG: hypothetical protein Fur0037_24060 [Planctomycetota bacterium]
MTGRNRVDLVCRMASDWSWIEGPALSVGNGPGVRVEVAHSQEQGFASLCDEGRFSRVLLSRIAAPDGSTLSRLAWKLQRDVCRPLGSSAHADVDNAEIEGMWRREIDHLRRLAGRGAVRLVAAGPDEGRIPPHAFDRKTGRLFAVVSPSSWGPLVTCRDDSRLRDCGLEPWSGTTSRYLVCASGESDDFYTWSNEDGRRPKASVRVRRRHDIFRDLVAAHERLTEEQRAMLARRHPDLAAVLADLSIEEVEQRIAPLCFYDSFSIWTEFHDLQFDEYCDLAGGASPAESIASAGPGRRQALLDRTPPLASEGQWFSAPWIPGDGLAQAAIGAGLADRLGLEAALLKLNAFVSVCRAVAAWHEVLGVPHLGLSSDNIMFSMAGTGGSIAPVRWRFEGALVDAGAQHRMRLPGAGATDEPVCLPAGNAVSAFCSPMLDPSRMQKDLAVRVSSRTSIAEEGASLELRIRSSRERIENVCAGDAVRILPDVALAATGEGPLVARIESVTREGVTARVPIQDAAAPQEEEFTATATFVRRLRTPCDLFSLGMLLARAMLCNDERDVFAVRDLLGRMTDRMETMLSGSSEPEPQRVFAAFRSAIDGERQHLDVRSVLWPAALREAATQPVPARLWREILTMIARLLTPYRGFAYAAHHGDVPDDDPAAPVRRVMADAEELLAALRIEFGGADERAREISSVASALVAETSRAMAEGQEKTP